MPVEERAIDIFGRMAGTITICGDIVSQLRTWNGPPMPTTSSSRATLLDTHIWLWLIAGSNELNVETRRTISRALGQRMLRIAAISLWEIALLASRNQILLSKSVSLWFQEALGAPAPAIEALTPSIAIENYELPGRFHADPADRLIVATARITGATLLTRDREILDYAVHGHLTTVSRLTTTRPASVRSLGASLPCELINTRGACSRETLFPNPHDPVCFDQFLQPKCQ